MTRDDNLTRRFTPDEVQAAREALAGSPAPAESPIGAVLAEALGAERVVLRAVVVPPLHAIEWRAGPYSTWHGYIGDSCVVSVNHDPSDSRQAQRGLRWRAIVRWFGGQEFTTRTTDFETAKRLAEGALADRLAALFRIADGDDRSHPDRVDGRPQATPDASPDEAP